MRYLLGRLAILPFTLLIVAAIVFSILHLVPGDAADVLAGDTMSLADRAVLRHQYGLDDPVIVQFARWLVGVMRGDLGTSISTHRPVVQEVVGRLGVTIELSLLAITIALVIGIVSGALATFWHDRWLDRVIMSAATLTMSIPNYFAATGFILIVALYFPRFGVVSYVPLSTNVLLNLKSLMLPSLSLAIFAGATFCRYVRAATEEILSHADFVRTARAKGASEYRVLLRHVLPNALIPLITVAGLQFAYLIGGTVVIETIFALPGIGQLMIAAIAQRDYPIVQGCVLLQAINFVVVNLAIDLLYPILDPRVRTR